MSYSTRSARAATAFLAVPIIFALAGCTTNAEPTGAIPEAGGTASDPAEAENIAGEEGASLMTRLGERVSTACGGDNSCYATAGRVAGYVWQYRESVAIQVRVFRCVGQYAVISGYRFGVRRFIGERPTREDGPGMVAYLYDCAVPDWATNAFADDTTPPVPGAAVGADGMRTAPAGTMTDAATRRQRQQRSRAWPAATPIHAGRAGTNADNVAPPENTVDQQR